MNRAVVTIRTPAGEEYDFGVDRARFTIGRSATCDLALPSPTVSSTHAEIRIDSDGGGVWITDLGSKNGTSVAGERIAPHESVSVDAEAEVRIANVVLRARPCREEEHSESLSLETSHSLSRALLRGMLGDAIRQNRVRFQVTKGPSAGARFVIEESVERILIGSGTDVDLDLAEPALIGRPIHVVLRGRTYCVVPTNAAQLRVNRKRVTRTHPIRSGDKLRILNSAIQFIDPLQAAIDELALLESRESVAPETADDAATDGPTSPSLGRSDSTPASTALDRVVYSVAWLALAGAVLFLLYALGLVQL